MILYIMCLGYWLSESFPGKFASRGGTELRPPPSPATACRQKLILVISDHIQATTKQINPHFPNQPKGAVGTGSSNCWRKTRWKYTHIQATIRQNPAKASSNWPVPAQ